MEIEQIDPQEAYDRQQNNQAVYLDVRTVEEFEAGHPAGSHNIPVLINQGGQMTPNSDFQTKVEERFPKDTVLVVGCRTGARSQRACDILAAAGYQSLSNVQGSFAGTPAVPGWVARDLPVDTGSPEGRGYQ